MSANYTLPHAPSLELSRAPPHLDDASTTQLPFGRQEDGKSGKTSNAN